LIKRQIKCKFKHAPLNINDHRRVLTCTCTYINDQQITSELATRENASKKLFSVFENCKTILDKMCNRVTQFPMRSV